MADPSSFASSQTFTPTAAAYSAGDVMDVAKEFKHVGPSSGGEVLLTSASLEVQTTALQSSESSYTLEVYSQTPPSALADNAPFDYGASGAQQANDRAAHLCSINLGTPVDKGSTLLVETDVINKQISVPVGGSVWGYLVTVGGFTATAVIRKVVLHTVRL